jgi:nitrite reductase/ring-hydroxylating ferredoxin subunit
MVTRDRDGKAHAFFNACRHRGAPVVTGHGKAARFSCPYHAWTYSTDGSLVTLSMKQLFGDCDKEKLGLAEIRVEERYGMIFGVLDPEARFDLDAWLGDYGAQLEALHLERAHPMWSHAFEGPNWKLCRDGFIENYHFSVVHSKSLPMLIGNVNVTDHWGVHSRMLLPNNAIQHQRSQPEDEWNGAEAIADVYVMFPNVQFSSAWGDYPLVTRIFPGGRADRSTCAQMLLTRKEPTPDVIAEAETWKGMYKRITQEEDYALDYSIQRAAENNQGKSFLLGRNEFAVQHFHKSIARFVAAPNGSNGPSELR